MTPDLTYLVWSAALCLLQVVIAALGATQLLGLPTLAGNRDALPAVDGWAGRAQRAHRNLLENLVLFAILVLVAHVARRANATTAMGAMIFFWARVAYAVVYIAGLPWVRTGVWAVSIVGLGMIFLQLV